MRPFLLPLLVSSALLSGCSGNHDSQLSTDPPGLDVADVALSHGAPDTALHIAQQVLATTPDDVPALLRLGQAQAMLGQREAAMHSYAKALAVSPDNADAALGLGRLQLATDPAAAAAVFVRLTTREPRNVAGLIDLGIAHDLLGQHAEAQLNYRAALAVEPERSAASVNLGLSLALTGDTEQALGILRPLAEAPGASPRLRQDFAATLVLAGKGEEAASLLDRDMPEPQVLATLAGYRSLLSMP